MDLTFFQVEGVSFGQHEGQVHFAIEGYFTCGIGYEVVSLSKHGKNHLDLQLCKIIANTTHHTKKGNIHSERSLGGGEEEGKRYHWRAPLPNGM